jgi:addiction module HigA family antidote
MGKKRKPTHPGEILEEHYIKPLKLNLSKLAEHLSTSRNTLYKIRKGTAGVTASIASALAAAFDTTPQFWLNLQQKYDLWGEEGGHESVRPIVKNGELIRSYRNLQIAASPHSHH